MISYSDAPCETWGIARDGITVRDIEKALQ